MTMPENPEPASVAVLYEDEFLVVVFKPPGLFVHRSDADRTAAEFLLQIVRDQIGAFVYPVHRLDRATSGILMLAKSSTVAASAGTLFAERRVSKSYLALVRGHPPMEAIIDTPMISARGREKPEGHPHREPQQALTRYWTRRKFEIPMPSGRYPTTRCALLDVAPSTGRFHQIRRHMNYDSHPIIGDSCHGDTRQNRFFRDHLNIDRLMLVAVKLSLSHPVTGDPLVLETAPDASFLTAIEQLACWEFFEQDS